MTALQVGDRKSSLCSQECGFRPGGRGEAGGDWASWSRRAAQRAAAEWTHGGRSHDGAALSRVISHLSLPQQEAHKQKHTRRPSSLTQTCFYCLHTETPPVPQKASNAGHKHRTFLASTAEVKESYSGRQVSPPTVEPAARPPPDQL